MTAFKRVRGLTLIELMVTVVILAILSAIAYPLYQNQVRKARRVEAKSTLAAIALAEERRLTRTGAYGDDEALGDEYTELVDRMTDTDGDGPDYYAIDVAVNGLTFTLTATAQGIQAADTDCAEFTINQLGQRLAEKSDGSDNSDTCW